MKNTIASIVYKHGDNDYSIWFGDLKPEDMEKISRVLDQYTDEGWSVRGSKKDIIEEIEKL